MKHQFNLIEGVVALRKHFLFQFLLARLFPDHLEVRVQIDASHVVLETVTIPLPALFIRPCFILPVFSGRLHHIFLSSFVYLLLQIRHPLLDVVDSQLLALGVEIGSEC